MAHSLQKALQHPSPVNEIHFVAAFFSFYVIKGSTWLSFHLCCSFPSNYSLTGGTHPYCTAETDRESGSSWARDGDRPDAKNCSDTGLFDVCTALPGGRQRAIPAGAQRARAGPSGSSVLQSSVSVCGLTRPSSSSKENADTRACQHCPGRLPELWICPQGAVLGPKPTLLPSA